jgi:hypothetical protein
MNKRGNRDVTASIAGVSAQKLRHLVDADNRNILKPYAATGKPLEPTPDQVEHVNREAELPAPEDTSLHGKG